MYPALLDHRLCFPDPQLANADGLVAVGGDLSVDRLMLAYRSGVFPWTVRPVTWWSLDPRGIIELDRVHVPRRLARTMRQQPYAVTHDRAFRQVLAGCAAAPRFRSRTWITPEFITAYTALHDAGHAHSVECWQDGELVSGLYGVCAGGMFAGESMFHRVDNASKIALLHLILHLQERGFTLFDLQMVTPVTSTFGAIEIPRADYLRRLAEALKLTCEF